MPFEISQAVIEAGQHDIEAEKKSGTWDAAYRLKEETTLPPDFKKALQKNKKAKEYFQTLSNSNKFVYAQQVNKIKTKSKREERIQRVIYLLEKNIKPYIGGKSSVMDDSL